MSRNDGRPRGFVADARHRLSPSWGQRSAVSGADKFAGVDHTPAPATGSPRLSGASAWIDCAMHAVHPGGDHLIVVGRVEARGTGGEAGEGGEPYDVATQGMRSPHVMTVDGRTAHWSLPFRYVWPAELDLMARLAGMRLRDRWAGWRGEPFTNDSTQHVSVWEKV